MPLKVTDFYRQNKDINPFIELISDPVFCIRICEDKKERELVLELKGNYLYPITSDVMGFEVEAYNSYNLIVNTILQDSHNVIGEKWHLSKHETERLVFLLYVVLVEKYSSFSIFKRRILLFLGFIKFYLGRFGL